MSKLSENFGKRFIVTGEIAPPRGHDLTEFNHELEEIKKLMPKLDGVNVVDIPGSLLLMSSLAASIILEQNDVEPIYQLVCRDRNMLALQADLIGAAAFGIENVLALAGDHPACKSGDHPTAMPVYDFDSTTLVMAMKAMNQGKDIRGRELNKATNFFVGAALAPGATPVDGEIYKIKRKLNAGADFFQTQAVFEPSLMQDFLDRYEKLIGEDVRDKVLIGLVPLYNYGMIQFLRTIPGIIISDETANKIKNASDPVGEGINIVAEYIDFAKEISLAGVHLMPAGKVEALIRLVEGL